MRDKERYETLDPEDWSDMRRLAHRMVDDVLDYLEGAADRPAWQPVPDPAAKELEAPAPRDPSSPESVYDEYLETIQPYTMHTAHPRFWAWYMGSGTVMGALGDFLASSLNPNLGGGNHAAPLVEKQVVGWICRMMGYPE
ncbi:MAG: amino acid decarboxylase, partial [Xanthomonadales bacterium]|nr:amino acid decarboxylase [Xanthomonadales bacterium]